MELTLKSRFVGNVYVIQCAGKIIAGPEAKALEAALDDAAYEFRRFVLSLSQLTRLDSIGLGLLVRYAVRLRQRDGDIRLAAPPPFLVTLLDLTKLSETFQSFPTEEEAILSFLRQRPVQEGAAQRRHGPRVLVVDESADLCVFVRTVLQKHGFDVNSSCLLADAKVLLQVDKVDYILAGPSTPQCPAEMTLKALTPFAPRAAALRLDDNFKSLDAEQATSALLRLFNLQPTA
jgi:anti-anti-sigma factor